MADRGRDLEISVLSNADKFDLDGPARDLDHLADSAKDTGAKLGDLGDDGKRAMGVLADESRDTAKKVDRAFDAIAKSGKQNLHDKLDDTTHHAREGLKEVGAEAQDTGREMAASFTGSSDDIMGALQELGANAGVAFGPIGGALSVALGAGLGMFFADWQKKKEKLTEDVQTFTQALVDGAGQLSEEFLNQQIAGIDPKELKDLAKAAQDAGLNVREVIRAYAGDPESIAKVNAKINEGAQALRDSGIAGSEADPGLATYADAVATVSDKLGITADALGQSKTAYELMKDAMSEPVLPQVDGSRAIVDADNTRARVEAALGRRLAIPVGVDGARVTSDIRLLWANADKYFRDNPITIRTKAGARPVRDVP